MHMLSTIRSSNSMARHLGGHREEEAVGVLHDVGLVDRGHLVPAVGAGVVEGELDDPAGALDRDRLDRDARVLADVGARRELFDHPRQLQLLGGVLLELDAGVEVLGVLPHDDDVDVLVARAHALVALAGSQAGVEVELLAEGDVHAPEAGADRGRDGPLDGDAVPADRLQHGRRKGRSGRLHDVDAGLLDVPVEVDAGRLEDAPGGLRDLGSGAVAGDEGDSVGHADELLHEGQANRPLRREARGVDRRTGGRARP
jgi:hypothetical protein